MQSIFQNAKRLISMCLVTLLIVTGAITIFPTSVRAEGNTTNIDCSKSFQPKCGNTSINPGEGVAIVTGAGVGALVGSAGTLTLISTAGSLDDQNVPANLPCDPRSKRQPNSHHCRRGVSNRN